MLPVPGSCGVEAAWPDHARLPRRRAAIQCYTARTSLAGTQATRWL
jgi:hypothetical protein